MEIDQIKAIIGMMKENDLSEFSMEQDGLKIRIKRGPEGIQQIVTQPAQIAAAPAAVQAGNAAAPATAGADQGKSKAPDANQLYVVSPMVGTFYVAAAPEAEPYIKVGQEVDEETVVCIIEAMKVMNEIKAEVKGVITEMLVDNAKPVEFGQKLFSVRPK